MKQYCFLLLCCLSVITSLAQTPSIKWTKYINNSVSKMDGLYIYDIKPTKDKGFILAGADTVYNYNKDNALSRQVQGRPCIVKLDSSGKPSWFRSASNVNPHNSSFLSVQQTADDGYIAAGYANGAFANQGNAQFYIAKYNSNGTFQWDKQCGGTVSDKAFSIKQTVNGGFILAGLTASNDGDVTGNHNLGTTDIWLAQLDNSGNIVWKKCFGGTGNDTAYAVMQTPDNGFLIAGSSASNDGNVSVNYGGTDAWVIKTDAVGNLQWQQSYGGSGNEAFESVSLNYDGSFTFVGYTTSPNVYGSGNKGKTDLWAVKTANNGQLLWSKTYGGTMNEQSFAVQVTPDNGFLVNGYTESNDGDISGNNGAADTWILKLSANGDLLWQKCAGTDKDEYSMAGICLTENDFVVAGFATSPGNTALDGYVVWLGNTNIIKGLLYVDANSNGVKDADEKAFTQQAIIKSQKPDYLRSTIPHNGLFELAADTGNYITTVNTNLLYYNIVPASINSSFSTYFNTDSISFALQPIAGKNDLSVTIVPLTVARPGFDVVYNIYYKNNGTTIINNPQVLLKPDSRLTFMNATPANTTISGDTLKWNIATLHPSDSASISVSFKVKAPPIVNLNDTLTSVAIIQPVTGDETPNDNTAILKQIVVGSLDPNDKTESNGGVISPEMIQHNDYLNYTIRFQNMGTDTAFAIIVRDTLDSKLDWNTLQMVAASHSYQLNIMDGNKLAWHFNDIKLVDASTNEPQSHGFISYRIKPKNTIVIGDTIHNNASIYFDYNLPVPTNDAFTVVQKNVALPLKLLSFSGACHNQQTTLYWATDNEYNFDRFEVQRSTNARDYITIAVTYPYITTNGKAGYQLQDDLSHMREAKFYYRLKMVDKDGKVAYSDIVPIYKGEEQKRFTIYPNPVSKGAAFISIYSSIKSSIEIQVINRSGKIVVYQQSPVFEGNNTILIDNLAELATGIYMVRVINGSTVQTEKITIVR